MSALIKNGILTEMKCDSNFAYVLNDNSIFILTEYKVLQSQTESIFIRCIKMLYNGKTELYYLTKEYKSIYEIFHYLNQDKIISIIGNLYSGIAKVKSNGFLKCENIVGSLDHIYVDMKNYNVMFVYLPLSKHDYLDAYSFEKSLEKALIDYVNNQKFLLPVDKEEIISIIHKGNVLDKKPNNPVEKRALCHMRLIPLDQTENIIDINKSEFTIGQLNTNDYVCKNKAISRQHCKIKWENDGFKIYEWYGYRSNKTYINGKMLGEGESVLLKNNDTVQLANTRFRVEI